MMMMIYIFFTARQLLVGQELLIILASQSLCYAHHTSYDCSVRVISPTQRSLLYGTHHSKEKDIPDPGRIRTHKPGKQAAADPCLRKRGHCVWQ